MRDHLSIAAYARIHAVLLLVAAVGMAGFCSGQSAPKAPTPGPMLEQGLMTLDSPEFAVTLVKSSQTIAALKPKGTEGFDFTPGDILVQRSQDGYYHLGDIDLRLRSDKDGAWKSYSTAYARHPVTPLPASGEVLAAADLTPTLASDLPLRIVRSWTVTGGKLGLRFTITNKSKESVEIGSLGIPMIFNNVITGHTLDEAHTICSFYDPYIGEDAGYLQVIDEVERALAANMDASPNYNVVTKSATEDINVDDCGFPVYS